MGIATEDSPVLSQPHSKIKRPPPSSAQSAVNGAKSSRSSPSPSLSSKRPPTSVKQPPAPTSTIGSNINGAGPRSSGRQRRESQRPGDVYNKQGKNVGRGASIEGTSMDRKSMKRLPEPLGTSSPIPNSIRVNGLHATELMRNNQLKPLHTY